MTPVTSQGRRLLAGLTAGERGQKEPWNQLLRRRFLAGEAESAVAAVLAAVAAGEGWVGGCLVQVVWVSA